MKIFSLSALLASVLPLTANAALSIDSTESTAVNGAFLEKVWTVSGGDGDVVCSLNVEIAGNVFVNYDESLRAADGNVFAKVVVRSSSSDMLGLPDATINDSGDGFRLYYKNENALASGEVVTEVTVRDPSALSSLSAMTADSVVVGEGVLTNNSESGGLHLTTDDDSDIFVVSPQDSFGVKQFDVISSGDGRVQFQAAAIQADAINFKLSGDGRAILDAAERIITTSLSSTISGDGKVFVQTADLQAQNLNAVLSGDGKLAYATAGTCDNQKIQLSGEGAVYAGPIVCKDTFVSTTGDGKAMVQTTGTLTSVGFGTVKYVGQPQHIVSSSSFWKHINVKPAKFDKVKTYPLRAPPTNVPTTMTVTLKKSWSGNVPQVRVHWGIAGPIFTETAGLAEEMMNMSTTGLDSARDFGLGVLVVFVCFGLAAVAIFKLRARNAREEYESLA